ncbi:hypothetical protein BT93_H2196 [Corymbia citriodora subsp. variegata]|nr:hypothetical protein BT93_H2196 [Corymbia citriodora subsp. variegata]
MATLVCRGLQSCLDAHLVQEPMTALTLKLVSPSHIFAHSFVDLTYSSPPQQLLEDPKHHHHHHRNHHPISSSSSSNPNMGRGIGGWSFLHAFSTTSCQEPARSDQELPVYVHPLARASSLRLSPRSLELCTENLGCESSNIVAFDGDLRDESKSAKREQRAPSPCSTRQITSVENASLKAKPRNNINKSSHGSNSFPPPLTTIANDSIRVRPHRERGRLILEAVRAPQGNRPFFRAERSHGRLRLCFFKDMSPLPFDSEGQQDGEEEKDAEARTDGDAENETTDNDVAAAAAAEEEEEEEEEEGEDEEEEAEQDGDEDDGEEEEEGMEATQEIAEGKLGMEMLHHHHDHHHDHHHHQRRSWCKGGGGNGHESSRRMLSWKPLLVASS